MFNLISHKSSHDKLFLKLIVDFNLNRNLFSNVLRDTGPIYVISHYIIIFIQTIWFLVMLLVFVMRYLQPRDGAACSSQTLRSTPVWPAVWTRIHEDPSWWLWVASAYQWWGRTPWKESHRGSWCWTREMSQAAGCNLLIEKTNLYKTLHVELFIKQLLI